MGNVEKINPKNERTLPVKKTSAPNGRNPKTLAEWQTYLAPRAINIKNFTAHTQATKTRLQIACLSCGAEEMVLAGNLIRRSLKALCRNCGPRQDYTTENIRQIIEAHGGIFLDGVVENRESVVKIRCVCGAEQLKRAQDVRRRPESCGSCRVDLIRNTTLTQNDNLQTARQIAAERGGQCLTGKELVAVNDKLKWQCSLGHTWTAQLSSIKHQGTWCPHCDISFGENLTRALMEAAFGVSFGKVKPDFLHGLELDGFNPDLKLAFECHGIQHYRRSPAFHRSEKDVEIQIENDIRKQILCQQHKVTLIVVPYFVTEKGVDATRSMLAKFLSAASIKPPCDMATIDIDMRTIYDATSDPRYQAFARVVEQRKGVFDSKNYQGSTRSIPVTCEHGHTWPARPYQAIKGIWCPGPCCANKAPKTLATIETALRKKGWSLREKPIYKNAHQLLPMQCSSGHEVDRTWNAWEQGIQGCPRSLTL